MSSFQYFLLNKNVVNNTLTFNFKHCVIRCAFWDFLAKSLQNAHYDKVHFNRLELGSEHALCMIIIVLQLL